MNKIFALSLLTGVTLAMLFLNPVNAQDISKHLADDRQFQERVFSKNSKLLLSISQLNRIGRIESNFSIGGLKLGMTTADIKKILGKHKQSYTSWSDCFDDYATTLKFNKLKLVMNGNSLSSIETSNPAYVTESEIRVGDSLTKLKKAYSKFKSENSNNYIIYSDGHFGGVSFKINNGILTEISWVTAEC